MSDSFWNRTSGRGRVPHIQGEMCFFRSLDRSTYLFILCWLIGESVASIRFRLYFSEDGLTVHMNKTEETKYNEYMGFLNS